MRGLLARLVKGDISRRDFTRRMFGLGFGMMTVESMLDTVASGRGRRGGGEARRAGGFRAEPFSELTPYEQWTAGEGVPVHKGYFIQNVREVETKDWKRFGTRGALINLEGAEA